MNLKINNTTKTLYWDSPEDYHTHFFIVLNDEKVALTTDNQYSFAALEVAKDDIFKVEA